MGRHMQRRVRTTWQGSVARSAMVAAQRPACHVTATATFLYREEAPKRMWSGRTCPVVVVASAEVQEDLHQENEVDEKLNGRDYGGKRQPDVERESKGNREDTVQEGDDQQPVVRNSEATVGMKSVGRTDAELHRVAVDKASELIGDDGPSQPHSPRAVSFGCSNACSAGKSAAVRSHWLGCSLTCGQVHRKPPDSPLFVQP